MIVARRLSCWCQCIGGYLEARDTCPKQREKSIGGYLEGRNTCPEIKWTTFSYCLCLGKCPQKSVQWAIPNGLLVTLLKDNYI